MTKQELIERVASKLGNERATPQAKQVKDELHKKTVALVIDTVFAELGEYFIKARVTTRRVPRFTYPGFGTFTKKERSARAGRDPRSGEAIEIPASTTVGFAPGQELRGNLNRSGAPSAATRGKKRAVSRG